jgi:hypothetical protein
VPDGKRTDGSSGRAATWPGPTSCSISNNSTWLLARRCVSDDGVAGPEIDTDDVLFFHGAIH